jgi:hypothetical protein
MDAKPQRIVGKCIGISEETGQPCQAYARTSKGSEYCWKHDPATAAERAALYPGAAARRESAAAGAVIARQLGPLDTLEELVELQREAVRHLATAAAVQPRRITALRGSPT